VIKSLLMIKKTKKISVCVHLLWACFFLVRGARKSVEIGKGLGVELRLCKILSTYLFANNVFDK
jgi:hypothetical protein